MTVKFALPVADVDAPFTPASTAYVAGVAADGTVLVIVAVAVEPGAIVKLDCERVVAQLGSNEVKSKVRPEHPEESLFVTDTV